MTTWKLTGQMTKRRFAGRIERRVELPKKMKMLATSHRLTKRGLFSDVPKIPTNLVSLHQARKPMRHHLQEDQTLTRKGRTSSTVSITRESSTIWEEVERTNLTGVAIGTTMKITRTVSNVQSTCSISTLQVGEADPTNLIIMAANEFTDPKLTTPTTRPTIISATPQTIPPRTKLLITEVSGIKAMDTSVTVIIRGDVNCSHTQLLTQLSGSRMGITRERATQENPTRLSRISTAPTKVEPETLSRDSESLSLTTRESEAER